ELARRWAVNHLDDLDHVERDFYHASLAAEHAQQAATRARQRTRRRQLRLVSALLVVALVAGLAAWQQRGRALRQQHLALAQRIAAQADALRATNPDLAAQLALASYRLAPTRQTRTSLLNAIDAPYRTRFASVVGPAYSVVLSPDGHTTAIAG